MSIDFDAFVRWAEDRFDGDVLVKGNEVKLNSIFTEDHKHHLWCNPYGGKHERDDGCYRCFYTENIGTLVGLVMLVDGCGYGEAKQILNGNVVSNLGELEDRLQEFFQTEQEEIPEPKKANLDFPPYTELISELPYSSWGRKRAESYLNGRMIPVDDFLYCYDGDYKNRIVIPYYDREGTLIYWNTRALGKSKLRYLGPPKSVGIGKADVLYVPEWPKAGTKIYVTEGEFDALTLYVCGFYAAACGGKSLSEKQILMMRDYKVCLCLDQDNAGFQGLITMGKKLVSFGIPVSFVRPPIGFKDWNKLLTTLENKEIVAEYVKLYEKPFDQWEQDMLEISQI